MIASPSRKNLENEVNATVKALMLAFEEAASLPPEVAAHPERFNRTRNEIIRRVWDLSKECIRYGAASVQHD